MFKFDILLKELTNLEISFGTGFVFPNRFLISFYTYKIRNKGPIHWKLWASPILFINGLHA